MRGIEHKESPIERNIRRVLQQYDGVLAAKLSGEISILMPGAGNYPSLNTVIKNIISKNPNINFIKIDLVDPAYDKDSENSENKGIHIRFCKKTMQQFSRENPTKKYDIIIFEHPLAGVFQSALASFSWEAYKYSSRAAVLVALKHVHQTTLIIDFNYFQYEQKNMRGLLELAGVDCVNVRAPNNWLKLIKDASGQPEDKDFCSHGFVVKSNKSFSPSEIDKETSTLQRSDMATWSLMPLWFLATSAISKHIDRAVLPFWGQSLIVGGGLVAGGMQFFVDPNKQNRYLKNFIALVLLCVLVWAVAKNVLGQPAEENVSPFNNRF